MSSQSRGVGRGWVLSVAKWITRFRLEEERWQKPDSSGGVVKEDGPWVGSMAKVESFRVVARVQGRSPRPPYGRRRCRVYSSPLTSVSRSTRVAYRWRTPEDLEEETVHLVEKPVRTQDFWLVRRLCATYFAQGGGSFNEGVDMNRPRRIRGWQMQASFRPSALKASVRRQPFMTRRSHAERVFHTCEAHPQYARASATGVAIVIIRSSAV